MTLLILHTFTVESLCTAFHFLGDKTLFLENITKNSLKCRLLYAFINFSFINEVIV